MTITATTKSMFETLNTFRQRNGRAPLKAFKGSRAQLEALINSEMAAEAASIIRNNSAPVDMTTSTTPIDAVGGDTSTNVGTAAPEKTERLKAARAENAKKDEALAKLEAEQPSPSADEKAKADKAAVVRRQRSAKGGAAKAAKARAAAKPATKAAAKGGVSAASVLAEFGIAPKIGRALLRKHNVAKDAAAIRAFLNSRKK